MSIIAFSDTLSRIQIVFPKLQVDYPLVETILGMFE